MSGSGLIYGVIVVMWAAVLLPMWLRRHEDADEQFTTAMRVLARRRGADETLSSGGETGVSTEPRAWPGDAGPAPSEVLVRRRRTLAVLVALTTFLLLTAVVGLTGPLPLLASLAGLVAYVVYLRAQVVASGRPHYRVDASPVAERGPVATAPAESPVPGGLTPERHQTGRPVAPHGTPWEPVRVPPPTYTTKPAAPSPARTIDLSRPGFWAEGWDAAARTASGRQPSGEPDGMPAADVDGEVGDWYIDADGRVSRRSEPEELFDQEAPEHRWAVGD